jgi:superfamily II DNA/RNA helicase
MDEADRLLDMGFSKDIEQITGFLNKRNSREYGFRQTLLFSATVAPEIRKIADTTLLKGYKIIDTVGDEVEQSKYHQLLLLQLLLILLLLLLLLITTSITSSNYYHYLNI